MCVDLHPRQHRCIDRASLHVQVSGARSRRPAVPRESRVVRLPWYANACPLAVHRALTSRLHCPCGSRHSPAPRRGCFAWRRPAPRASTCSARKPCEAAIRTCGATATSVFLYVCHDAQGAVRGHQALRHVLHCVRACAPAQRCRRLASPPHARRIQPALLATSPVLARVRCCQAKVVARSAHCTVPLRSRVSCTAGGCEVRAGTRCGAWTAATRCRRTYRTPSWNPSKTPRTSATKTAASSPRRARGNMLPPPRTWWTTAMLKPLGRRPPVTASTRPRLIRQQRQRHWLMNARAMTCTLPTVQASLPCLRRTRNSRRQSTAPVRVASPTAFSYTLAFRATVQIQPSRLGACRRSRRLRVGTSHSVHHHALSVHRPVPARAPAPLLPRHRHARLLRVRRCPSTALHAPFTLTLTRGVPCSSLRSRLRQHGHSLEAYVGGAVSADAPCG